MRMPAASPPARPRSRKTTARNVVTPAIARPIANAWTPAEQQAGRSAKSGSMSRSTSQIAPTVTAGQDRQATTCPAIVAPR